MHYCFEHAGQNLRFPTEAPGHPSATRHGQGGRRSAVAGVPDEIDAEEREQLVARVAAIDVAKA